MTLSFLSYGLAIIGTAFWLLNKVCGVCTVAGSGTVFPTGFYILNSNDESQGSASLVECILETKQTGRF